jgi:predicted amidohydrolase YtcJ
MTDTRLNRGPANAESMLRESGKQADRVTLSASSLPVEPSSIDDIKVRETTMEAMSVHRAKQ